MMQSSMCMQSMTQLRNILRQIAYKLLMKFAPILLFRIEHVRRWKSTERLYWKFALPLGLRVKVTLSLYTPRRNVEEWD